MTDKVKFLRRMTFFVSGGVSVALLYGEYINAQNIKKALEAKTGEKISPVPARLKSLLEEVKSEIPEKYAKNSKYNFFMNNGDKLTHTGVPSFRDGTFIGIPQYFLFEKDTDVDATVVMEGGKLLTDKEELNILKQSMCLSKEAKKFGLAYEIIESHHSLIFPCVILPFMLVANFGFLSSILEKIALKQKKPVILSHHIIVFMFAAWLYALLHDISAVFKEGDSDKITSELGSSYIEGGIEFYEKMITRNKIMKKIKKSAPYTEEGDINTSIFRTNHMSLQRRLIYLRDFQSENSDKNVWRYVFYPQ